ncbi:Rpp20 subunit of nuclear RNase MRP and P-domain-containing protein [Daldinia sp. FL1419]|nr:Rpp20 subunit of nuclear RNase MRP and P-domain-containing protein [Daldinia sp. FL1419]
MTTEQPSEPVSQVPGGASKPAKLPPIPKGATVRRRPIPTRTLSTRASRRIYITAKTPFRSVTTRVRKQLDKNLREASVSSKAFTNKLANNKNASLDERIRAIQRQTSSKNASSGSGSGIGLEGAGEVVVLGTGRAIQKVVEVAMFFQKQQDCVVQLKTGSVGAVDDVVAEGEEEWGGEGEERTMEFHMRKDVAITEVATPKDGHHSVTTIPRRRCILMLVESPTERPEAYAPYQREYGKNPEVLKAHRIIPVKGRNPVLPEQHKNYVLPLEEIDSMWGIGIGLSPANILD